MDLGARGGGVGESDRVGGVIVVQGSGFPQPYIMKRLTLVRVRAGLAGAMELSTQIEIRMSRTSDAAANDDASCGS